MKKQSRLFTITGILALAFSISTLVMAQSPEPLTFVIKSRVSGKVLDIPGYSNSDHAQIQQVADNGGINQEFRLEP